VNGLSPHVASAWIAHAKEKTGAVAAGGLDSEWNARLLAALTCMRFGRALLHRIPEPSIRLFLVLAIFGAVVVTSLAMLASSGP
jgi:hypothetical protein